LESQNIIQPPVWGIKSGAVGFVQPFVGPEKDRTSNMVGRPPFAPTEAQRREARKLARLGISEREVARHLGIDRKTLRKSALGAEMAEARLQLRVRLMRSVLRDALGDAARYQDPDPKAVRTMLTALCKGDDGPDEGLGDTEIESKGDENDGKA
jgi:hypothetical protein